MCHVKLMFVLESKKISILTNKISQQNFFLIIKIKTNFVFTN